MTLPRADAGVPPGVRELANERGLTALVTQSGALERLEVDGCSILLYPASALADGAGGLWLRLRRGLVIQSVSLCGQNTPTRATGGGLSPADRRGCWEQLEVSTALRLSQRDNAWYWHVRVTNVGEDPVELDLLHAQDVALAPLGAVRTNEYYVSQYLDLTPVDVGEHGTALGVRQNMPGPMPWLLVGCLGRASRWATDALQLTGRGRPEGTAWPGLSADLPAVRQQGEHTLAALQTEPVTLQPGATWSSGFYGVFVADHPEATTAADARHAVTALADPAAAAPSDGPSPNGAGAQEADDSPDHRSLFGTAPPLACRALADDELNRLAGSDRVEPEQDGHELLSFFTPDGAHVVTAAKQARVLRPHGHLIRSGSTLLPDEPSVCVTVWMDGTFCSQLTQGHVSLGAITSVRRSYLGLAPAHGLRLFVRTGPPGPGAPVEANSWKLLGTPSAWRVTLEECTWWYAAEPSTSSQNPGGLLEVTTRVAADSDAVLVEVRVLGGPPVEVLAAVHVPWLDLDAPLGPVTEEPDGMRIAPPADSRTAELFPGGAVRLGWTPGSAQAAHDDPLFLDGRSRNLPWVTVQTDARRTWQLTITPQLVTADRARENSSPFRERTAGAVTLQPPATPAGRELGRIGTVLPWFVHDALIHYLSPRGLEQYTGGAWGTRDVSQGPVGLLLALGAHAELRTLLLTVFRAQLARGDWPQAFDFLQRHRSDGPSDAHGDVVYWPLLALGQYLAATGDETILTESVAFAGDGAPTSAAPLTEHVRAALDHVDTTLIAGTGLPAYGHGDWNDSLQPVDPELAARMCSTWTAVLQAHTLATLAAGLVPSSRAADLGERARRTADAGAADLRRLLLVDGVLAGYGLFPDPRHSATTPATPDVEPLIHPRDQRTGLTYSILAMIHAISADLLTPDEAASHLRLIEQHLLGPDGARLFDRPVGYAGGPMTLFQRAEASTFFGREIGIMYMHAHLRYAEALARVGDGRSLLRALALAQPVGVTDRLPSARPRQSTTYYSSSDAAFADRYAARDGYRGIFDGSVPLEGGWRVYSSGPGLYLQLLVERLLGLRHRAGEVHLDPVLDPELDGLAVTVPLLGASRQVRYAVGHKGHGVAAVRVGGSTVPTRTLDNGYRRGGAAVRSEDLLRAWTAAPESPLEIDTE